MPVKSYDSKRGYVDNPPKRRLKRGLFALALVFALCGTCSGIELAVEEGAAPSKAIKKILMSIAGGLEGAGNTVTDLGETVGEIEPLTADDMRAAAADAQEGALNTRNSAFLSVAGRLQKWAVDLREAAQDDSKADE